MERHSQHEWSHDVAAASSSAITITAAAVINSRLARDVVILALTGSVRWPKARRIR
jgi:hypothetical protein